MSELVPTLATTASTKIVLVVIDGLGGFRSDERGSELHAAATPNMDRLATEGSSGLLTVVAPGVTAGSGAGHLSLFGYDPLRYELGRGALSAAGVGFPLKAGDVAARVNFCTLDEAGNVIDRRAGRIPTDVNEALVARVLAGLQVPAGVEVFLQSEKDHRALLVLRGPGLDCRLADTDPQITGVPPKPPTAADPAAEATARILADLLAQIRTLLAGEQANFLLLRGFDTLRDLPLFPDRYHVRAQGIAVYPMYSGIARILGMDVRTASYAGGLAEEVAILTETWDTHDFFYLHHKPADSAGEDGDFDRKAAAIEQVDAIIPDIMALEPDVICVTGDHATPSQLRSHSWHPVPFVMRGPRVVLDSVTAFDEEAARSGAQGCILGRDLMALMLAAAGRLIKYGA